MIIARYIKKLIILVQERNNSITVSCPSLSPTPKERSECYKIISDTQKEIDALLCEIRTCTRYNFLDFTDEELLVSCYLFASIWSTSPNIECTSREFEDIIGRNRISRLPELIDNLLSEKSALSEYVSLNWHQGHTNIGHYTFDVIKPEEFNRLFLSVKGANND